MGSGGVESGRVEWCVVGWSGVECKHLQTDVVVISLSHIFVCSHNLDFCEA